MVDKKDLRILEKDFKKKVDSTLSEIKSSLYRLHEVATRDEKTGLYNYRYFKNNFESELEKSKRSLQKLCLVIIDIDHFKKCNDTYGHLVGDEILIELGGVLDKEIRKYDCLARFGGEEFFISLPFTGIVKAKKVAERLRTSLSKSKILKKYGVTISIGITEYKQKDSLQRMIKRADKALYISKKNGRNQVNYV